MISLGLTGSIGMGKSFVVSCFKSYKVPVYDADKSIHDLLFLDKTVISLINQKFPNVVKNNIVNRALLANKVFNNIKALKHLENILHPRLQDGKKKFLQINAKNKKKLVVLDIPLLFEKKKEKDFDAIIVVSAPFFVQKARVLNRPGMTKSKFDFIIKQQLSDKCKCKKADYIIKSGLGRHNTMLAIKKIMLNINSASKKLVPIDQY